MPVTQWKSSTQALARDAVVVVVEAMDVAVDGVAVVKAGLSERSGDPERREGCLGLGGKVAAVVRGRERGALQIYTKRELWPGKQ